MAGVGFELNKILSKGGYTSVFHAYGYAALVSSGPWIMAVLTLGFLGVLLTRFGSNENLQLIFVSLSFIYGITLVLTGPMQMILTRYAADQEFAGKNENVFPAFMFSLAWNSVLFTALGLTLFLGFVPGSLVYRLSACLLMVLVADIWVAGIFLTALKNYNAVLLAFACGSVTSLVSAWQLGMHVEGGAMLGLVIGHMVLFLILFAATFKESGRQTMGTTNFLGYFPRYWDLALGGFVYNLGIWIDKFLHWWVEPTAQNISGILYASPIFDRVVYFSFLTAIPGMAVFLLKLETEFASANFKFFQLVLKKGTLSQIEDAKAEMVDALRSGFELLLKVQGLCTVLLVLSAEKLLRFLGLGQVQGSVFQMSLIGVFLLVSFLSVQTILYYLDKRRDALICSLVFLGTNALVTLWSIWQDERWYGFGFMAAAGTALALSVFFVNRHLRNLEYDTFTSQPLYG